MATKKKTSSKSSSSDGTVGIDVQGISKMQSAVTAYVNTMKKEIRIGASTNKINQAIKGSNTKNTLIQMTNQIQTKIQSYLNALDQFNTQLGQLKNQYATADKNNTVFSSETSKIKNG